MTRRRLAAFALLALPLCAAWGCDEDPVLPADAPAGHTISEDGVAHMVGHDDPETNCAGCHGPDLRGSVSGEPSCYACHDQEW